MRASPNYGSDLIAEHYDEKQSIIGLARKLNQIDGKKSVKGWEMSIYRWKSNKTEKHTPPTPIPNEMETVKQSYHYDAAKDEYYTFLRVADQMICVDGDKHRAMKEAYSNMVGKGASMNEICREFGIPRAWFDEYRRRHGWTHDMSPYTDEELATKDVDMLVDDLVTKRKHQLHKKFERAKWKSIEESAEKYNMFEEKILNEFRQIVSQAPKTTPQMAMVEDSLEYALVISY